MIRRRVFFSSNWADSWRSMQIRNSDVVKKSGVFEARFFDAADIEVSKRQDANTIRRWINRQMDNTSVTCVLIGAHTSTRKWVLYEIEKSIERKNGLFGIYIHNVKDQNRKKGIKGKNPLRQNYATYDWVNDNGRENLPRWIDLAAKQAGRHPSRLFSRWAKNVGMVMAAGGIVWLIKRFLR